MSNRTLLACLALGALVVAAGPRPAVAKDEAGGFARSFLADVSIGNALQGDIVILLPLVVRDAPEKPAVATQWAAEGLSFAEPEMRAERYSVEIRNAGPKPVLVLGGTVLIGGHRDRMLRSATIVDPGTAAEVDALAAEAADLMRKEASAFQMARSLAPIYLRRKADLGSESGLVAGFVSRNLEFRNPGDDRRSLAAIGTSKKLQDLTAEARQKLQNALHGFDPGGVVVGTIVAYRGRVQGLTLYGHPDFVKEASAAYLLGATYSAAAVALQAERKNVPVPGKDDAAKTLEIVKEEAAKLLDRLREARFKTEAPPDGATGDYVRIQLSDGTRGRAVGLDGRLVHLAVYPHDPFESAYYGSSIKLPDEDTLSDPDRIGLAELSRGSGVRMTEYEKRLYGRLSGAARSPGLVTGRGGVGGGVGRR